MILRLFLAVAAGLLIDVPEARLFTTPVLGALLFVTFLSIPLRGLRIDARFLTVLALLNFVVVPLVVGAITWPLRDDGAVHAAVLLVLLAPCIDYVIAFSGLAGGARDQLLAATPFLLLGQMLLLPLYLGMFLGSSEVLAPGPFLEAFLLLIVVPLVLAALAQRSRWADVWERVGEKSMTPLMMETLFLVMAGYSAGALGGVAGVAGSCGHVCRVRRSDGGSRVDRRRRRPLIDVRPRLRHLQRRHAQLARCAPFRSGDARGSRPGCGRQPDAGGAPRHGRDGLGRAAHGA